MSVNLYEDDVCKDWLDAYGHLNEAYYVLYFANSMWSFQDELGIGLEYTKETRNAIYTAESHIRYLHEVRYPARIVVKNMVVDVDRGKFWSAHIMYVSNKPVATFERILLNFNQSLAKVVDFPQKVVDQIATAKTSNPPEWIGKGIRYKS